MYCAMCGFIDDMWDVFLTFTFFGHMFEHIETLHIYIFKILHADYVLKNIFFLCDNSVY